MSAEPPQIAIRTPEERLAEEAPKARVVIEMLHDNGETALRESRPELAEVPVKTWRFHDYEAACAWIQMRARELSNEGTEIYLNGTAWDVERVSAEARTKRPLTEFRFAAVEDNMLEW